MQISYEESLANSFGLQRRGGSSHRSVLSVRAKGNAGQPLSSRFSICGVLPEHGGTTFVCRSCPDREKAISSLPFMARHRRTRRSHRTCACVDIPNAPAFSGKRGGRSHQPQVKSRLADHSLSGQRTSPRGNVGMNAFGKSDDFVVPLTQVNNAATTQNAPKENPNKSGVITPDAT